MDFLTLMGLVIAVGSLLTGQMLEGGHADTLLNFPAFMIVFGGTLGAALIETPVAICKQALWRIRLAFVRPVIDFPALCDRITTWSRLVRKDGLLSLENILEAESDIFVLKGLNLLIDGHETATIRQILALELEHRLDFDLKVARVYQSMGAYAPTIGIIGAVMGLIHVMTNLDDPAKLGTGIAVAFVATIYGVAFANLILLPLGAKLKQIAFEQALKDEMTMEGLLAIANGENPRLIELKLQGFYA